MSITGLVLIIAGWIIQLVYACQGKRKIQAWFLVLYALGCALLSVDGFITGSLVIPWLNLCLVVAALILLKVKGKAV